MVTNLLPGLVLGLIALQAPDAPDPAELVTQLGAPRYADRETAGEALVKLGRAALPALTKARESRDPEIRLRAENLVARIEAGEILDATRVRLDIRDRSLGEAAKAIATASGMRLRPGLSEGKVGTDPTWPDRRVTLAAAEPVPFWSVLDQFCQAGGLQREYPPAGTNFFPVKPPFDLTLVPGKTRPPVSDSGAFRVELLRVRHRRERDYGNNDNNYSPFQVTTNRKLDKATGVSESSSYMAELLISAEPRLRIFGVGEIEKPEAVDDQGRSLLKTLTVEEENQRLLSWQLNPHLDPRLHPALRYGSGMRTSMRTWPVSVLLSYPNPRARRIAAVRGVFPVVVIARRPDPLIVELKGASGKEFSAGSTKITIHEIKAESGREPTVEFTLETDQLGDGSTISVCDSNGVRLAVNRPSDLMELRLEVLDSRGESLFWQYNIVPTQRTQGRMKIVIHDRNSRREQPDDLRLRFWGVIAAATDLPFEFKDVPTP